MEIFWKKWNRSMIWKDVDGFNSKNEEERAENRVLGDALGTGLKTPGLKTMRPQRALND